MFPYWGVCDWDISDISHIQPPSIWIHMIFFFWALSQSLGLPQKGSNNFGDNIHSQKRTAGRSPLSNDHISVSASQRNTTNRRWVPQRSKTLSIYGTKTDGILGPSLFRSRFWVSHGFPWFPTSPDPQIYGRFPRRLTDRLQQMQKLWVKSILLP